MTLDLLHSQVAVPLTNSSVWDMPIPVFVCLLFFLFQMRYLYEVLATPDRSM